MDEWRLDQTAALAERHSQGSERQRAGRRRSAAFQLEWDRGQMAQEAQEAQADKNWLSAGPEGSARVVLWLT